MSKLPFHNPSDKFLESPDIALQLPPGDAVPYCPYCKKQGRLFEWLQGYPHFVCDTCNATFFIPKLRSKCKLYVPTIVQETCQGCPNYHSVTDPSKKCVHWVGVVKMPPEFATKTKELQDYQRQQWGARKVA